MLYVLDTDIFTLLQRQAQTTAPRLFQRLPTVRRENVCTTIITYQEQSRGCLAAANRVQSEVRLLDAYQSLQDIREAFCRMTVLPFDLIAKQHFDELTRQRIRIGTMDLRIAAITLAHHATLVTRNGHDFERIPGLGIEDWTD